MDEGEGFDKKISMSDTCDFACLSPCVDLGNLGAAAAPKVISILGVPHGVTTTCFRIVYEIATRSILRTYPIWFII